MLAFIFLRVEFLNRTQKNFFCTAIEQRTLLPRSRSERSENNSAAENAVEGRRLSNRIVVIFRVLPVVLVDCRCTGLSSSKYGCIIHDGLNRMGNYSCGTAENKRTKIFSSPYFVPTIDRAHFNDLQCV